MTGGGHDRKLGHDWAAVVEIGGNGADVGGEHAFFAIQCLLSGQSRWHGEVLGLTGI